MSTRNIERIFKVLNKALFRIDGELDYNRITDALTLLGNVVYKYCKEHEDTEHLWSIGEFGEYTLDDVIIGAYWHYVNWHGGQDSPTYAAQSSLGRVWEPNMSGEDEENYCFIRLNELAEEVNI